MKRVRELATLALALLLAGGVAHAKKGKDDDESSDADDDSDKKGKGAKKGGDDADDDSDKKAGADADSDDDSDSDSDKEPASKGPNQQDKDAQKQDLTGHDLGNKKENEFEKDRFYVDKADGEKTEKGTLVQGSLAASTFAYTESGGALDAAQAAAGSNAGKFSRYFEDLRLQTDFRHIGGGRWDARLDGRLRVVNSPGAQDALAAEPTHVQSGFNGTNEYELKELWLVRNGIRSDVILGRQFVSDLGAIKIDGLRVDYASSRKLTIIAVGGLYPLRGSRSITTDYPELKDNGGGDAGKFVLAGGGGAAYRTLDAYGAIGGVVLSPTKAESPRVFATANGYMRVGPQLDFYHFAIVDLIAQSGANVTAATAGINYKPSQRLRLTAAFNRVDTDTLNVQAQAFLDQGDAALNAVQNEAFVQRLSTNSLRGGVSAALGELQRFELSTAATFRYRPDVTIAPPAAPGMAAPTPINLPAAKGVDLYASLVDRHSIKDARLGIDVSRTFGIGAVPYQRTEVQAVRLSAAHEVRDGRGEWEAEAAYAGTKDVNAGAMGCTGGSAITQCFGSTTNTIISLGGNFYYRINRDWFTLVSASLTHQDTKYLNVATNTIATDPGIIGLSGFFRIAYRF